MRVEDFIKLYYGCVRIEVEIYAIITVFHEKHRVLVLKGGTNNAGLKRL